MKTPKKDRVMPNTAKREGFNLKTKEETNIDQIGVVFTNTVALIMVVSKTAETNSMKCRPKRIPKTETRRKSFRSRSQLKDLLETRIIMIRMSEAIIKRQKAIEKTLRPVRKRINMAAVPKRVPAVAPSRSATLLLLLGKR